MLRWVTQSQTLPKLSAELNKLDPNLQVTREVLSQASILRKYGTCFLALLLSLSASTRLRERLCFVVLASSLHNQLCVHFLLLSACLVNLLEIDTDGSSPLHGYDDRRLLQSFHIALDRRITKLPREMVKVAELFRLRWRMTCRLVVLR